MAAQKTIHIPSQSEIGEINKYQQSFNSECASAIKWIYRIQGWKTKEIEKRIPGVKSSVWRAYGQQAYNGARSLHVCAALSWLTQITMSALYYGNNIEKYWQGIDIEVIKCIAYSGLLPRDQFEYLVMQLLAKKHTKGYADTEKTRTKIEELKNYNDVDFLIPETLDINQFKEDYYKSIAQSLKEFRINHCLNKDIMAYVLGVSLGRYESYESPEKSTTIPLHLAMRLKLGFKIENTVSFTQHMTQFKAFNYARNIQQIRENVIISLMEEVDLPLRKQLTQLAYSVMNFHLF